MWLYCHARWNSNFVFLSLQQQHSKRFSLRVEKNAAFLFHLNEGSVFIQQGTCTTKGSLAKIWIWFNFFCNTIWCHHIHASTYSCWITSWQECLLLTLRLPRQQNSCCWITLQSSPVLIVSITYFCAVFWHLLSFKHLNLFPLLDTMDHILSSHQYNTPPQTSL